MKLMQEPILNLMSKADKEEKMRGKINSGISLVDFNALEAIAHLRGLIPNYKRMPEQPKQNIYHLHQGRMIAYQQRMSRKNIDALLKYRPRRN